MIKYVSIDIVFQEVPNETTLAINISNCPNHCMGCHSKHLWEDIGKPLKDDIDDLLKSYKGEFTCIAFMGGDNDIQELFDIIKYVKNNTDYKICWYTGKTYDEVIKLDNIFLLDFLKTGRYIEKYGGLKSKTTNQKFYVKDNNSFFNKTDLFWKK